MSFVIWLSVFETSELQEVLAILLEIVLSEFDMLSEAELPALLPWQAVNNKHDKISKANILYFKTVSPMIFDNE